jgi:hypothetical protein
VTDLGTQVLFDVFPALSSIPDGPILSVKFDSDDGSASIASTRFSSGARQVKMEGSLRFVTRCIEQSPFRRDEVLAGLDSSASCLALVPDINRRFSEYYNRKKEYCHPNPTTTKWDRTRNKITNCLRQMSQWSEQAPGSVYPDKDAITKWFGNPRSIEFKEIMCFMVQSIMDYMPEKLWEEGNMFYEGGLMDTLLQALIPDVYEQLVQVHPAVARESLEAGQSVLFFGRD